MSNSAAEEQTGFELDRLRTRAGFELGHQLGLQLDRNIELDLLTRTEPSIRIC